MRMKWKIANLNVAINILTALILDFPHFKRHIETLDPLPSTFDMYSRPSTFEYTPLRQFATKTKSLTMKYFTCTIYSEDSKGRKETLCLTTET